MQITISGKQVDLSDALQTRVADQLNGVAGKYFDHALEAKVTFSRARSFFVCDINLHAGRGLTLRGEGEASDAHAAFDDAAAHIAKRLRRYRRRVNEHARDLAARERGEAAQQYVLEREAADEVVEKASGVVDKANGVAVGGLAAGGLAPGERTRVVAERPAEILRLTLDEALMHIDLEDQPALMFRHRASGRMNVVYRRDDGTFGWIDPAT
jgi:ribosomal subunit interface protein